MNTLELIYAIAAGKATEAQAAFEAIAAERATEALDTRRKEIAQNFFKKPEELAVEEEKVNDFEASHPGQEKQISDKAKKDAQAKQEPMPKLKIKAPDSGVKEEVGTEKKTELDEAVSHNDIDYAGHRHSDLHTEYERGRPGHAKRVADLEHSIKVAHGEKALKHIQKNTELYNKYVADDHGRKTPMDKAEFNAKYGAKMLEHLKGARVASMEHQKEFADRAVSSPNVY